MNYADFLEKLDSRLEKYFDEQRTHICCRVGCSSCCERGDYPLSQIELEYIMQGYVSLENEQKLAVQENVKNMQKGGACPFLVNRKCSIYHYRPIICRVHGLAYICGENTVKVPFCVNEGKNFSKVFKDGEIISEPIKENLDTPQILAKYDFGEIRNLYDWIKND